MKPLHLILACLSPPCPQGRPPYLELRCLFEKERDRAETIQSLLLFSEGEWVWRVALVRPALPERVRHFMVTQMPYTASLSGDGLGLSCGCLPGKYLETQFTLEMADSSGVSVGEACAFPRNGKMCLLPFSWPLGPGFDHVFLLQTPRSRASLESFC